MQRLTDAQRDMARDYFPLAMRIARDYARKYPRLAHEIRSEANLCLVSCAGRFDPSLGFKFKTYAIHRITRAVRGVTRLALPKGYRAYGQTGPPTSTPYDDGAGYAAVEPGAPDLDAAGAVAAILAPLRSQRRTVMTRYYADGLTWTEVAASVGVCRSRVSRLRDESLAMLRKSLTA